MLSPLGMPILASVCGLFRTALALPFVPTAGFPGPNKKSTGKMPALFYSFLIFVPAYLLYPFDGNIGDNLGKNAISPALGCFNIQLKFGFINFDIFRDNPQNIPLHHLYHLVVGRGACAVVNQNELEPVFGDGAARFFPASK